MDQTFLDIMRQVGEPSEELLAQRWGAVEQVSTSATPDQAARLVRFAHRVPISRAEDEWFWSVFRTNDPLFPIDDGVELHARLADACVRWRIREAVGIDAQLVRLAAFGGLTPVNPELPDVAREALIDTPPIRPTVAAAAGTFYDDANAAAALEAGVDPSTIVGAIKAATAPLAEGVTRLNASLAEVTRWADRTMRLLEREEAIIHWLLSGLRADGTPWMGLSSDVIALDAAAELALIVRAIPQNNHERALAQVISLATENDARSLPASNPKVVTAAPEVPAALVPLVPLHDAQARKALREVGKIAPTMLGVRYLWERTTVEMWPAET
jgi:hypothetical protein